MGKPLKRAFFARSVLEVAPDLIGATMLVNGAGGIIVEVEAYHHTEPAAHSFNGPTPRNGVMFGPPGVAYVYRSYGIHWCVNFVCEKEGSASAVLIRALQPTHGIPAMRRRRGLHEEKSLCSGPGKLTEALGITDQHNALALDAPPFALHARVGRPDIVAGIRIGITKAAQLVEPLEKGLALLRSDPERFRKFNASNGWGKYEHLVAFVEEYLGECRKNPDADVEVSR